MVKSLATSTTNLAACSNENMFVAPVAEPGTTIFVVVATPTTGALAYIHGCTILLI